MLAWAGPWPVTWSYPCDVQPKVRRPPSEQGSGTALWDCGLARSGSRGCSLVTGLAKTVILRCMKLLLVPIAPTWTLSLGRSNPSLFSICFIFFCCKKDCVEHFPCWYTLRLTHDSELYWQIPAGEEALMIWGGGDAVLPRSLDAAGSVSWRPRTFSSTPMGRSGVLLEVQSETPSWLSSHGGRKRMLCTWHSPFPAQAFLQKSRPVLELLPSDVWLSPQFSSITKTNERFFFSAILLKESLYLN